MTNSAALRRNTLFLFIRSFSTWTRAGRGLGAAARQAPGGDSSGSGRVLNCCAAKLVILLYPNSETERRKAKTSSHVWDNSSSATTGIARMKRLQGMEFFVEVAKTCNFGRAAANLGVPKSTVSRQVAELERSLGLRLLSRTTRRVQLTDRKSTRLNS